MAGGSKEPIMATPPKRRALEDTGEKVLRYEAFVSDVLQRDLRKVLDHRDKVYEQLSKYLQLRNVIERLQEATHSELCMQVDLGCNFFVDTVVSDTSRIYVALGYGFFLELTLAEALKFIDRKSNLLTEASENCKACRTSLRSLTIDCLPPLPTLKSLNAFFESHGPSFPPYPPLFAKVPCV
ncbi:protein UXT isoform X1 [Pipistrellus kuhlii]|uniref:protein UXT isoform X1 n=1 Tax=Pipistrellus kuhlii TaxID=59472 RepID=UPI00174EED73|nr:protein UXT isoform X1 [Pipistrellus kuhlii]